MRDINTGGDVNVQGDFIITDNSQEYKLLIHCNNAELLQEENHRRNILNKEKKSKRNRFIPIWVTAALLLSAAAVWFWMLGKMDIFSLLSGAAGIIIGLASLKTYEKPNSFEQRQHDALREIHDILRDRGVR